MGYHTKSKLVYIGQTGRRTNTRIKNIAKKKQKTCSGNGFWKIIFVEVHLNKRLLRKAVQIEKNIRNDSTNLSNNWKTVLKNISRSSKYM